ncbi:MAG: ACR3 family arsenite efflux transporter [Candidatus Bipolaricaulota bacterium]|nr:ACR3 family arsenite efflux transporter [Candidatus Bipolaricaulota bacterium]MDW8152565.1 ACR3 family arsenite efflux transporter [Candidatus Bipolaricaulota bacterium]
MAQGKGLSFFERYLSIWVALCILVGIGIGWLCPAVPEFLRRAEVAQVSIPVAVLIWLMIYPMMVQIDFSRVVDATKRPKGLALTLAVNWAIKPFTMAGFAALFFFTLFRPWIPKDLAREYYAGAVLLGAAPCTAMVFVWSYLSGGDPAYTLVQVAVNDLVLIIFFAPIVKGLLGLSQIYVPYLTVLLSVILYVVIPLVLGYGSRRWLLGRKGASWFEGVFLKRLRPLTVGGLLLTLVILFSYQGGKIIENPTHIFLIAIPLAIQTFVIFGLGYLAAWFLRLPHAVAAPAAQIGASNFFELAVAVAISLFGLGSGAALATVVGVLEEVPIMLTLVWLANRTRHWFRRFETRRELTITRG